MTEQKLILYGELRDFPDAIMAAEEALVAFQADREQKWLGIVIGDVSFSISYHRTSGTLTIRCVRSWVKNII